MSSIEEFKKRIAEDDTFAKSLFEAQSKAGKDPETFTDAMTEFTSNLMESTKRTVTDEVDKIVKQAVEDGKKDALDAVSKAFGLTEDSPVMRSELAELIRKGQLEADPTGKRGDEDPEDRDGDNLAPTDKVLDPAARFAEMQKERSFSV